MSNLLFISKIMEKAVLTQLQEHLSDNGLLETCQSPYRKEHSSETALLAVTDNILSNTDNRLSFIVAFLDLSVAMTPLTTRFCRKERVSHTEFTIKCFSGSLLQWPTICHRRKHFSKPVPLQFDVPQGSVLGSNLFILYT